MRSSRLSNATPMPERGEIWLADLNPRRGTEPGKSRPVLIIQAQALLDVGHPSTLIIPLTTSLIEEAAPLRIRISARERMRHDSDLLIDQLRAFDSQRLLDGPLTRLDRESMRHIGQALLEVLDLTSILDVTE
jgi:mRNA interferase MazF